MLVCHCKRVFERDVRSAIASGASTRPAVTRDCGAGSVCGGCGPLIDELLERHAPATPAPRLSLELSAGR